MALLHLVVVVVCAGSLFLDGARSDDEAATWIVILLSFAILRTITTGHALAGSTYIGEPIAVALFLAGTGGPDSPFLTLALAGIWWVSRTAAVPSAPVYRIARRRGTIRLDVAGTIAMPRQRIGLLYVGSLVAGYLLLVLPQSARDAMAGDVVQDAAVMIGVSLLSEALARAGRSAGADVAEIQQPRRTAGRYATAEGVARGLRTIDISADAVLTAGQHGLTAVQAELLAYLLLGLTNQEIADAIQLTEATVRYRLTGLYRVLGVSGRKQAAERARELGLTGTPRPRLVRPA